MPGKTLRKERVPQMLDKKLVYLKKHIKTLISQGVLEDLQDVTDCHASPAHIIIESRFVASKNAVVEKTRFTADMREINKCLPNSSYPLPNCDAFRRECAQKNYKVFSNLNFFYQFNVNKEMAYQNFGVYALNRIYCFMKLAIGLKISPSYAQQAISRCFR